MSCQRMCIIRSPPPPPHPIAWRAGRYMVNILYFNHSLEYAYQEYWDAQVMDLFGSCVRGFHHECTDWMGRMIGIDA